MPACPRCQTDNAPGAKCAARARHPRRPLEQLADTVLHQVIAEHLDAFLGAVPVAANVAYALTQKSPQRPHVRL